MRQRYAVCQNVLAGNADGHPLFAYIIGFTLLPILSNIKESFIDQRFGRRYDILVSKRADITYDIAYSRERRKKSL